MVRLPTLFLSLSCLALGRPAVLPQSGRGFQVMIHDINQVEMCISNFGKFGQTAEYLAGCWWPTGSEQNYIWGAGLWFGAIVDDDTLVTVGYSPYSGESEFTPGLISMSWEDPDAIVYIWPWSWPPPADKFPMAPQLALSHQDSWCTYNDLDPGYHSPGDTRPIGVEVYQTVYAWDLSLVQDVIFIKYVVRNVTGTTLANCYFGVCTDNDIGFEGGYGNDLISGIVGRWYWTEGESLWVDNLGYQWQEQPEQGWEGFPGTIAFDYLQSPWDLVAGMDKDNEETNQQGIANGILSWLVEILGPVCISRMTHSSPILVTRDFCSVAAHLTSRVIQRQQCLLELCSPIGMGSFTDQILPLSK